MGAGASSSADGAVGASGSRFASLPSTGRYAVLRAPGGGPVHVLGVVPASRLSAIEAGDLVRAVSPTVLYVDEAPELVAALSEDVAAGACGPGFASTLTETPRPFAWRAGAGLVGSVWLRKQLVDNEMFALLGAELYAPQKAALSAAAKQGAIVSGATSSGAPAILAYPFALAYNNFEQSERHAHYLGSVEGDASVASTAVAARVANPWLVSGDGAGAALVTLEARVPPERGYLTRLEVCALQARNARAADEAARAATAASADVETRVLAMEERYNAAGDADSRRALLAAGLAAQGQAQAVAHVLRTASASLPPGGAAVALVNIGAMAALLRNWDEARPPAEAFPPMSAALIAAPYALGALPLAGAGWITLRAARRFPRSTAAVGLLLAGAAAVAGAAFVHQENTAYGPAVRAALARPRVTAPHGKIR